MLELWVLVWVSLTDPVSGAWVDNFGYYDTHEECIYAMRDAEIMVNRTNEGMMCLQILGEQIDKFPDPVPGDGSLY